MENIRVKVDKITDFVSISDIESYEKQVKQHHTDLQDKTGKGNDFLGWVNLPSEIDMPLLTKLKNDAAKIQQMAEILVVIGIGGSYLGARAVIDAMSHNFSGLLSKDQRKKPYIVYAGNNLSEDYLSDLLDVLEQKEYAIAVISKSGTTTEPAIAFRILKNHLEKKYGKEKARERIFAITDQSRGALKSLADREKYASYVIPDDVGGRYSVLTPVGLLPIAVAGFDIEKLVQGALFEQKQTSDIIPFWENNASVYAAARNALYKKGKNIEILVSYFPSLHFMIEWWKQLYGESEGKEKLGIFPAGVDFTSDLHSMGQYIQDGRRELFETVLSVEKSNRTLLIPKETEDADGLNFLSGRNLQSVNRMAEIGTLFAHVDGGVPNICISVPQINEEHIGQLIYFFEKACAVSGYILGVNPFDQPGVEAYKKNMFALLGKKGFEQETEKLQKRMQQK